MLSRAGSTPFRRARKSSRPALVAALAALSLVAPAAPVYAAGDLAKTTDTEGRSTVFAYDSSHRLTKITTPEGRVTVFTYDGGNRVRSMLRAAGFDAAAGHTGPTYAYAYSASPATHRVTRDSRRATAPVSAR